VGPVLLDRPRGERPVGEPALAEVVLTVDGEDRALHPFGDGTLDALHADDEVRSMISALLFAGYDTTRNQLGLAAWLFCDHPDQWRLLAERPELAAPAVEEVMRHLGAVGGTARIVAEDLELDGYALPAGTILMISMAAANHDVTAFVDPDRFDITAEREPQLTFGGGPHYCLGASLARAEMQEALPRMARALPDLALDGDPTWRPPTGIYGPETLPVRFTPTA
jgi:cytochrome P450